MFAGGVSCCREYNTDDHSDFLREDKKSIICVMCMYIIEAKCKWAGESNAGIRRMYGKTNSFNYRSNMKASVPWLCATGNLIFLAASFLMTIYT